MKKKILPAVLLIVALGAYLLLQKGGSGSDGNVKGQDPAPEAQDWSGADDGSEQGPYARPQAWLEIPACADEDYVNLYSFDMTLDGVLQRNYSLKWNESHLTADWVAYPLCKGNIGEGDRSNAFGVCPYMPQDIQPVIVEGYRKGNCGWYSRGHQIPSGDRRQYSANVATFYGVNMTPQDEDFNGGLWENLESKVRWWSRKCDTLYVVTGCTYDGYRGEYVRDNENRHVAVPTGYYKALLMRRGKSFHACAFSFENRPYEDQSISLDMAMSLDELESRTGMEFFPLLKDMIGEHGYRAVKSENPSTQSCWGR